MLRAFKLPIGWVDLARRTLSEVIADNCLGLAAQLRSRTARHKIQGLELCVGVSTGAIHAPLVA